MSGKGSKPRPVSRPIYDKHYDQIRWHSQVKTKRVVDKKTRKS